MHGAICLKVCICCSRKSRDGTQSKPGLQGREAVGRLQPWPAVSAIVHGWIARVCVYRSTKIFPYIYIYIYMHAWRLSWEHAGVLARQRDEQQRMDG